MTPWFNSLKWAEQTFQELPPVVAELRIDAVTHGKSAPFDKGARDYLRHYHQRLRPLTVEDRTQAA